MNKYRMEYTIRLNILQSIIGQDTIIAYDVKSSFQKMGAILFKNHRLQNYKNITIQIL